MPIAFAAAKSGAGSRCALGTIVKARKVTLTNNAINNRPCNMWRASRMANAVPIAKSVTLPKASKVSIKASRLLGIANFTRSDREPTQGYT